MLIRVGGVGWVGVREVTEVGYIWRGERREGEGVGGWWMELGPGEGKGMGRMGRWFESRVERIVEGDLGNGFSDGWMD